MSSSDALKRNTVKLTLGDVEVNIHYGMASLYYLSQKYGQDIREVFGFLSTASTKMDSDFIKRLSDIVYAGLWEPDDEGEDTSGWSTFKVMTSLDMSNIPEIMAAVTTAVQASLPNEDDVNPPKGAKAPRKKAGIGDTSSPPQEAKSE